MSDMAIQQLLAQMRTLSAELDAAPKAGLAEPAAGGFGSLLEQALQAVNTQQAQAGQLATALETGAPGVDVAQVMIEVQKAGLAFKAMTEARNRLISAYQDIMNMSV
ncbi:MAG TPA: flagellar hook-basal body complex protein FliE [Steroidobacteraceae bacterium]|nr:flagellar hook-basal body complex protein FliE [Steroidobacteraceae bacterium]